MTTIRARNLPTAVLLLSAAVLLSCNSELFQQDIKEGIIEYHVTFPYYDQDNIMASMLPESATLEFKDDKFVSELSAGIAFKTSLIGNNSEHYIDQTLQLLNKRFYCRLRERDVFLIGGDRPDMTLVFTNETDTVAGFLCKKAIAIFNELDQPEIELYYTDRIALNDPNWHTPFADIPGVLLKYEIEQYNMRMRLEATSVEAVKIPDERFQVKEGLEEVKAERIQYELQQIMETFEL